MSKVTIKLKKINGIRQVPYEPSDGRPALIQAEDTSILEVLDLNGTTHSIYSRTDPVDINKAVCYSCALSPRNDRTLIARQICRKLIGCNRCATIFERIEDSLERL